ncbi:hypothetical protein, conserved [Plasmodium malariae]|uniref:S1 motif domain-containing protein n=1 Tax=Plasmodium malariae TaxID=5858 RepID=A0A1A8WFH2_PLAMA|nr:hypothetical protein, conserved [Plasmodium malariae]
MIFINLCLLLGFPIFNASAYLKRNRTVINYIYYKTDKFKKRKQNINFRLRNSKDEDTESYIPHIYKDIAPCLKDLADEEYSYKDLLNVYFPETVEREKKMKEEKELREKKIEEKDNYKKFSGEIKDTEKIMKEKLRDECNIQNFEHISKINDHKKKNKALDIAYDVIEDSLKDIYLDSKFKRNYNDEEEKKNYLEIAKKEKDMLYTDLINKPSIVSCSSTVDLFGVFYDSKDYKNEKKLLLEMDKIINSEPFKSNQGNILQDVDTILKKNKIPTRIRNFLIKYRSIAIKINNMKKSENGKKKVQESTNKQDANSDISISSNEEKENEGTINKRMFSNYGDNDQQNNNMQIEGGIDDETAECSDKKLNEGNEYNDMESCKNVNNKQGKIGVEKNYKDFLKDLNKVIITLHNNINNEKLIRRDQYFIDELYEEYKKHVKSMHIKRNRLEPQKNKYDFLTFVHEHYEEYYFFKYGNFAYDFNEQVEKVKSKIEKENCYNKLDKTPKIKEKEHTKNVHNDMDIVTHVEGKEEKVQDNTSLGSTISMPTVPSCISGKADNMRPVNTMSNNKECTILKGLKNNKKLKKHVLVDIIRNYQKRIYDIYKPNNFITNLYGFDNYIENEKYDKEINITLNKYSILNYDSKEALNNDERLYVGKLIFGKIFKIEKNFAYVDINYAFYAELHVDQMPYNIDNIKSVFKVNDKLIFEIFKMYPDRILLTLKNIQKINDLNKILLHKTQDIPFDVHVVSLIKNGINVSYNDIYTFIHISALSSKYKIKVEENEKIDETIVNQKIKVLCTDINKLSFSNLLYEQNEQLKKMNMYDLIEVEIIHISKYGLMVKYEDVVGLIHISEISKKKIDNIDDIFKINDKLKGIIINIDYDNRRFSLSMKILERDGRNIIDHKSQIYDDLPYIVEVIKKRNSNFKIDDSNIKNQLLSLIDIYRNDDNGTKGNTQKGETNSNNIIKEKCDTGVTVESEVENEVKSDINRRENVEGDLLQNESAQMQEYNEQIQHDDKDKPLRTSEREKDTLDGAIYSDEQQEERELSIDIHNQLIPYIMLKQTESEKTEDEEKGREIIWNLEDEEFLHSNSPVQSIQCMHKKMRG